MLKVTDAACAHLAEMLTAAPDGMVLRFIYEGDDLVLKLDHEQPTDQVFAHLSRTVLALDERVADLLAGKTLDVEDTEDGPQLALQ